MKPVFKEENNWAIFYNILIKWIGTEYKHLQYEIGKGADCGLFIAKCLQDFGILTNIEIKYHPRFWYTNLTKEILLNYIDEFFTKRINQKYIVKKVNRDKELINGDILTFNLKSNLTNHIGVYIEENHIIDSRNSIGVKINEYDEFYLNKLTNIYRIYING